MIKLSESSEIFAPQSPWAGAKESILAHNYDEVMQQVPFEEAINASDRKICRIVELIVEQPFSEAAKALVLTLLHRRDSFFNSAELVMRIGRAANATMRAYLLVWLCDTPRYMTYERQLAIKRFVNSLFLGIAAATSQAIDTSVFAKTSNHIWEYFSNLTSALEDEYTYTVSDVTNKSEKREIIQLLYSTRTYNQEK